MTIKIKDVLFTSSKFGEFNDSGARNRSPLFPARPVAINNGGADPNRVKKILTNIKAIFELVVVAHREELELTEKNSELITRGILDEFSFYTKESPLSIEEYNVLIDNIAQMASGLPPNIHLQLATFPVLWPNKIVQNCVLHVQSPANPDKKPIIHHFHKVKSSGVDPQYGYQNTDSKHPTLYPLAGDNPMLDALCQTGQPYSVEAVLQNDNLQLGDVNQYKNAIKITSADGEEFLVVADICLDHKMGMGERHLNCLIQQLSENRQPIPYYASHIISSKTISSDINHMIATVAHADHIRGGVGHLKKEKGGKVFYEVNHKIKRASAFNWSTYESRELGILAGAPFDLAVDRNIDNGFEFDINALLADKTLLHHIVQKSDSEVDLVLKRINTLKQYEDFSIDIPDVNDQTVRDYIIQELDSANQKSDLENMRRFLTIAKHLRMFDIELRKQIYTLYTKLEISLPALAMLRNFEPTWFNNLGQMIDPQSKEAKAIKRQQQINNAYLDLCRSLAAQTPDYHKICKILQKFPRLLFEPLPNGEVVAQRIAVHVQKVEDRELYQLARNSLNIAEFVQKNFKNPAHAAISFLKLEFSLPFPNPAIIEQLIKNYSLQNIQDSNGINFGQKALALANQTKNLSLYQAVRNSVNVLAETKKFSSPQQAALNFLHMEALLPHNKISTNIIFNLLTGYPGLIQALNNDGVSFGQKALDIALNTKQASLYEAIKNNIDVPYFTTRFANPVAAAEAFLSFELRSKNPNEYHIMQLLTKYPGIGNKPYGNGLTLKQQALNLAYEYNSVYLYSLLRNEVNIYQLTKSLKTPHDEKAALIFLGMELSHVGTDEKINSVTLYHLLQGYPSLHQYLDNTFLGKLSLRKVIQKIARETHDHSLLALTYQQSMTNPAKNTSTTFYQRPLLSHEKNNQKTQPMHEDKSFQKKY